MKSDSEACLTRCKTIYALTLLLSLVIATASSRTLGENPPKPRVRIYYIAADDVMWNYAPGGRNLTGTPGPENEGGSNSTTYRKAAYHEYTDGTFATLKPRPTECRPAKPTPTFGPCLNAPGQHPGIPALSYGFIIRTLWNRET